MFLLLALLLACASAPTVRPCDKTVGALALATAGAIDGTKWALLDSERVEADLMRATNRAYTPGPFATPEAAQAVVDSLTATNTTLAGIDAAPVPPAA